MRLAQHAGLACVAVFAGHGAFDGAVDVGVVKHDEGRIAAQLQRQLFDAWGPICAIRMRPTSVEPVKLMWRTASLAQNTLPMAMLLSLSAVSTFNTPAGMPARMANSASGQSGQRRELCGLDDDRTTGRQCGRHLAGDHGQWEVPWRDGCAHANRLRDDHQAAVVRQTGAGFRR
jgi:hypothetical protein